MKKYRVTSKNNKVFFIDADFYEIEDNRCTEQERLEFYKYETFPNLKKPKEVRIATFKYQNIESVIDCAMGVEVINEIFGEEYDNR